MNKFGIGLLGLENVNFSSRIRRFFEAEFSFGFLPLHRVHTATYKSTVHTTHSASDLRTYMPLLYELMKTAEKGCGVVKAYDGYGKLISTSKFNGLKLTEVNFGDLDFSADEDFNITCRWGFDQVSHTSPIGQALKSVTSQPSAPRSDSTPTSRTQPETSPVPPTATPPGTTPRTACTASPSEWSFQGPDSHGTGDI